ncbi:MAG: cysteine desulfurase [Actinomycetota bacterium]|nr:cysteine desulfurase [Actinomycetota bacterium]
MAYLDHAATTPVLPVVAAAVAAAMTIGGNPSSLHGSGRRARRRVEESRESIAAALGAHPTEVLFTSGGTESDNLAVTGLFRARVAADGHRRRVLVAATEHHAVLDAVEHLAATAGAEIDWLEVDGDCRVLPESFAAALAGDTGRASGCGSGCGSADIALATVMWANNEVGTANDIAAIAAIAHDAGIPLHTDAVQAAPILVVDFAASGAAALSVAGHKLGGPGGTGLLLLRRDAAVVPLVHGGGQERGLRSGTLDVAGIVGLAAAVDDAVTHRVPRTAEYGRLRGRLVDGILAAVPDAVLSGDVGDTVIAGGPGRLPGLAHFRFPGCESETLLMLLDSAGVECSAGSACSAGVTRASHVLLAMGLDEPAARSSLRFSLGHTSSDADVDAVLAAIGPAVDRARGAARRSAAPYRAAQLPVAVTG